METTKKKLRQLLTIQGACIVSVPFIILVAELVAHNGHSLTTSRRLLYWIFAGLSLWSIVSIKRWRHRFMPKGGLSMAPFALDEKTLTRWRTGFVLILTTAESVVLWGFLVRTALGMSLWYAVPFYLLGIGEMLLGASGLPSPE